MGSAYNIQHNDDQAVRWFDLARRSSDPGQNLRRSQARFQTTLWRFPVFSTRWHDLFSYGHYKTEWRSRFPVHAYVRVCFVGGTGVTMGAVSPQFLGKRVHSGPRSDDSGVARNHRLGGSWFRDEIT